MPRKTRAAAKAEEAVLVDTDAPQEVPLPPTPKHEREREPLRSITPNSVDSIDNDRAGAEEPTKGKPKKGKKAGVKKKGRKAKNEALEEEPKVVEESTQDSNEDTEQPPDSAVEVAEETPAPVELQVEEPVAKPVLDERPASSLGRSTRMTRRQQALAEAEKEVAEPKAIAGELVLSPPEPERVDEAMLSPVPTVADEPQPNGSLSPLLQELPDRTRPEPLSLVASNATSRRSSQVQDPIEAIDALEDEIDEVTKIIPALDSPTSPVKVKATAKAEQPKSVKPSCVATAKSAVARTAKPGATSQSAAVARNRSLAEPKRSTTTLSRSSSTKGRPTSVIMDSKNKDTTKDDAKEGDAPDYLAAKRRPISIHFPTPPPPPKSKKAPTTSNFVLPGEAIAAKLKAQRAERQKRGEEEAAKRREFKARPVPTIKPKPVEVKQTAASRARLGLEPEKDNASGLKRSATVTGATSSTSKRNSSVASKRSSVIGAPKPSTAATATTSTSTAQKRSSLVASKPVIGTKPRPTPVAPASHPAPRSVSASEAAAQRLKGKEVYNRDKVEKEARERAQREKDEAIKRARAEAAERGRQASREWAEKQKRIALEKKMKEQAASGGVSPIQASNPTAAA
ncbi:uncharacterized protein PV09_03862 [Verruconis gallopava]|uniref:Uncharacterized protein n=1 Tax=Verruconis gallopava TaxID=253628 RepID=A0A0D2B204_9PEZI|nr:uncharacterized protein PV09_03862 [Verruconis gallopava]KIW05344.1 hypothetical protein PV09_03862 [Verruconis gallopava]